MGEVVTTVVPFITMKLGYGVRLHVPDKILWVYRRHLYVVNGAHCNVAFARQGTSTPPEMNILCDTETQ